MGQVSQADRDTLEVLHQQDVDGTIKPEHKKVLNRARSLGRARYLSGPDKIMKFVRTPTSKIVGTAGAEILGETLGGAGVAALGPGKVFKGAKFLGRLAGIGTGNVAGQAVTKGSQEEIDPRQTAVATTLGGVGLKTSDAITGLRNLFRPKKPTVTKVPGTTQAESTAALRSANRLLDAGIVPRVANVIKNQAAEIIDAIATSAPFARGIMREQRQSIQKFYEEAAEGFSKHFVTNTSKLQTSDMARELIENDVNLALRTRTRNYQLIDDLSDNVPMVDLSGIGKGQVSFLDAGKIMEKASDKDFRLIRKKMREGVDEVIASHPDDPTISIQAVREQGLDSPENLKFTEEFNKVGGDKAKLTANIKARIDTALMFSEKKMRKMKGSFLEEMVKRKPEVFLDAFIQPKGPRTLKQAMDLLPKPLRHKIQSHFIGSTTDGGRGGLLHKATVQSDGGPLLDGARLVAEIDKFEKGFGNAMGMAMFPGTGLKALRNLGEELAAIQGKKGTATGSTAIFLMTPGAAITLGAFAGGGFQEPTIGIATAAGVLFLPRFGARKLNNMKFVTKLVRGLKKWGDDDVKMQKFLTLTASQLLAEGINSTFVHGDPATSPQTARIGGAVSAIR